MSKSDHIDKDMAGLTQITNQTSSNVKRQVSPPHLYCCMPPCHAITHRPRAQQVSIRTRNTLVAEHGPHCA